MSIDRGASPLSLASVLQQAWDGAADDGPEDGAESSQVADGTAAGRPLTAGDLTDGGY